MPKVAGVAHLNAARLQQQGSGAHVPTVWEEFVRQEFLPAGHHHVPVSGKVHESPDGMGTHRESPEGMGTHPATAAPHLGAFSRSKEFVTAGTEGICDAGMFAWVTANTCPHPVHPKMHMLLSLWLSGRDLVTVSL